MIVTRQPASHCKADLNGAPVWLWTSYSLQINSFLQLGVVGCYGLYTRVIGDLLNSIFSSDYYPACMMANYIKFSYGIVRIIF